jgi:hypothetical protein
VVRENTGRSISAPAMVISAAGAPVICETAEEGRKDDTAFLREQDGD